MAARIDAVTALWAPATVCGLMFLAACAAVYGRSWPVWRWLWLRVTPAGRAERNRYMGPWRDRKPGEFRG